VLPPPRAHLYIGTFVFKNLFLIFNTKINFRSTQHEVFCNFYQKNFLLECKIQGKKFTPHKLYALGMVFRGSEHFFRRVHLFRVLGFIAFLLTRFAKISEGGSTFIPLKPLK
jgi:hypothetical protein